MPWLLREEEVLAALEVADTHRSRRKGLLGRTSVDGAMLLDPARSIHTLAMRMTIDVAYCRRDPDGSLVVIDMATMPPWRIGWPRMRARCVIEAEGAAFDRWGLKVGDVLTIS